VDLVEFLTAGFGEEESFARAASTTGSGAVGGHWATGCVCDGECRDRPECERVVGDNIRIYPEGGHDADQARHIAYWDPARVLAEVAAKRRILARHSRYDFPPDPDDGPGAFSWTPSCEGCHQPWPCRELLDLVSAYSGRAGFRPEWSLDG
jgi:Family of unknown function (DUF6221)